MPLSFMNADDNLPVDPGSVEPSADSGPSQPAMRVVGIGASAGGLGALKKFFASVPDKPGVCFVVVVHLSPQHESHLANLLQPNCRLPVQQVTGETPLEANHVYVIPPDSNIDAIDTHLHLSDLEQQRQERAPIDHFFRTLADAHHERAVGVVLTGTGSDGTSGLKRIRERGGLTIVQSPDEAEYDSMPRSAIAAGLADLVLPLDRIAASILEVNSVATRLALSEEAQVPAENTEEVLKQVLAAVRAHVGHDFMQYKRSTLLRRIHRRMHLHRVLTLWEYLQILQNRNDEVALLFADLLITVTEFFRDAEVFEHLEKKLVPEMFKGITPEDRLRVWSVGCATGEEAYSLAILLLEEEARSSVKPKQLQVFATDLHEPALRTAREGIYPETIEADVSERRLQQFFTKKGEAYRIRKDVRERIVFALHNVLQDPPFSHLRLISCRNLLIYLKRESQQRLMAMFHYALKEDGYLLVGTAEGVDSELFVCVNKQDGLYRRRNVPARNFHQSGLPIGSGSRYAEEPDAPHVPPSAGYGGLHEQAVELYAPPSILISPDGELVHYSARAGRFLEMPGGTPTNDVFQLLPEPLRYELRAAVHAARGQGDGYRSRPIPLLLEGRQRQVILRVQAIDQPRMNGFHLVIFDEIEGAEETPADESGGHADANIRELEAELERTKKRMQSLVEDHEAAQERTQAYNEELESTNEELRSTMEELETSKEEMQSMNEELTTLNQENLQKVEELDQLSGDLHNLLTATNIATVFLDRDMCVMRFTPSMGELFGMRDNDRGRSFEDLAPRLGYEQLREDFQRVLRQLTPVEREIARDNGKCYMARLQCYRTIEDRIEGAVITFFDITDRKRVQETLEQSRDVLEEQVTERTAELGRQAIRLQGLVRELSSAEQRERKRIGSVLHDDLQQVLVAVKMQLGMARSRIKEKSALKSLDEAVRHIDEAVDTTRSLVRQVSPQVLYEHGLISALHWLSEEMSSRHHLKVRIKAGEEEPPLSDTTKTLLFESLREMLFNTVKHADTDRATVEVKTERDRLSVTVSDKGSGFDVDAQADDVKGSGFGLFSIRDRIEALGGSFSIDSAPGRGTRLGIVVPLAADETVERPPAPPEISSPLSATAVSAKRVIRVLVVDDHALVRDGIAEVLKRDARMVVVGVASDGVEAIAAVERYHPDVVLMDLNMPRMNGVAATREIRRRWPLTVVIGLSMEDANGVEASAITEAGAAAFLPKSDDSGKMIQIIGRLTGPA